MLQVMADIELTRRCDLACAACFVRGQEEPTLQLDTDFVLSLLPELGEHETILHLTGGEPFLHPGIWSIMEAASALRLRGIQINTHAGLLDDQALARLGALGIPAELLVSLDGPPGVHARTRGQRIQDAAIRVLARSPAHGVRAEAASILTNELLSFGLARWLGWLREQAGRSVDLSLFVFFLPPGTEPPPAGPGTPPSPGDIVEAADQVAALVLGGEGVRVCDYPLVNPLLLARGVPRRALQPCMAGHGRFCVQADGWVSPCHPLRRRLIPAGPRLLQRLARHPDYQRMGRRAYEGCRDCQHRPICGHCRTVVCARGFAFEGSDGWCEAVQVAETQRRGTTWTSST